MKMVLYLKNGAVIETDVTEFKASRNPVSGEFEQLTWSWPDDWKTKLVSINPSEIVAVVAKRN